MVSMETSCPGWNPFSLLQTRFHGIIQNTYTLFDGLEYNKRDILLIACIFPRPCWAWTNTTQLAKYLHIVYAKPSNKVYVFWIIP